MIHTFQYMAAHWRARTSGSAFDDMRPRMPMGRLATGRRLASLGPQAVAVSKATMLRVSRLNSTPMRWTGRPEARYFAA